MFQYPNGWFKPILDIYVSIAFQWYKKLFNLLGFDPYNFSSKIWKSTRTLTPQMGVALGVWRFIFSHSPTLPGIRCVSRASILSHSLASPYFDREPKVMVETLIVPIKLTFEGKVKLQSTIGFSILSYT
jgi:hypothetical protein